jgi:hypothetical protein
MILIKDFYTRHFTTLEVDLRTCSWRPRAGKSLDLEPASPATDIANCSSYFWGIYMEKVKVKIVLARQAGSRKSLTRVDSPNLVLHDPPRLY